ncbi:MAG: stage V sporulation protein AE [bacterium]|jgi:stage V sporulation protein AE|nr:stage V sporulation protein AE [Bacillota bacterium]HHW55555.1 stage V sporulation protein AE [Bacillota bacterium]
MDYLLAFLVGGTICALGQLLMDLTPLTPAHVLVLFVCTGAILSGLGIYEAIVEFGGAGATIPLPGFGHTLTSGVIQEIEARGFWGIFSGVLENASVGVVAAVVVGLFISLIFNPKG